MTSDIKLTANAVTVLERRYLKKDADGTLTETPGELFRRVADNVAAIDARYDASADTAKLADVFYSMMTHLYFLPNSPTLMNAGRDLQQLSACFVLPVEDAIDSIFDTIKNTALIHKSGGGTGFSFNRLRPKHDVVKTTGGVASGPISFMKVFNAATEEIKQGGTRRGANMAILNVEHPDIKEFITVKQDLKELTNFNLSVALSTSFMEAAQSGRDYELINPRTGEPAGTLNAGAIFDLITEMAWKSGEPGIIFLDRINRDNPTPGVGAIESTNPCGEQPLLPYESCNLGSINLARMVENGAVNYGLLENVVKVAVHFLDNVIDANKYPLPEIAEMTLGNRKIGLGVMGFADMLIMLDIPYDSDDALTLAGDIMKFIREKAVEESVALAAERGTFPNFEKSIYAANGPKLRNATLTTIAPTGTLSIIAGCSSGIEPLFALAYTRTVMDKDALIEINPLLEDALKASGYDDPELMKKIAEAGDLTGIETIPPAIKARFVTSHNISPEWHVEMQAAFQNYTDNAVSKTVNFPQSATVDDVRRVFELAYARDCKGVTIYRDGSRDEQVLTTGTAASQQQPAAEPSPSPSQVSGTIKPRARSSVTRGTTEKMETGCGNLYVTTNYDDKGLCEVFGQMGKAGGCAAAQSEAVSRLISLALRAGIDGNSIVKQLKGIRCPSPLLSRNGPVFSCPDAIAKALEHQIKQVPLAEPVSIDSYVSGDEESAAEVVRGYAGMCPECGEMLEYSEGCVKCRLCGYTKCG